MESQVSVRGVFAFLLFRTETGSFLEKAGGTDKKGNTRVDFDGQMSKQQGHRNAPGLKTPPGLHWGARPDRDIVYV